MIFEELILNEVSELETSNPGDLSSVAAIYVETRFSMQDSGGINLPSLRTSLKAEAVNIFSLYYASLGKPPTFFIDNTINGTAITSEGETITLERVEFINLGEEECEDVVFKKVFFIPLNLLSPPAGEDFTIPSIIPSRDLPTAGQLKICNYRDFKDKAKFIQTFMKINFLALQRPTSRSIVKGINFRKFSTKKKQITKFIDFLDDVVPNKPNKFGESIIIHFAENFQTVSKIEYINENVSDERQLVFRQSEEEFQVRKYKAFNDVRVNFYLYNFESIYPDLFATTFRGINIKFDNLVRRNFLVPNDLVTIVQNDCLAAANLRQNVSAADVTARIRQSLSNVAVKEARSLLKDNPFKTAEELIEESGFLESKDIAATMKQTLNKEFLQGGHSIKDEVTDFFEQLQKAGDFLSTDQDSQNSSNPKKTSESQKLSKFGQFANSIEWQQILAIALASVASRYGIDEILDESFIKKQMAERISKFFKDPRTINALMSGLPTSALQRAALFFATIDLANSLGGGVSLEERRLRRLNRLLGERAELLDEQTRIIEEGTSEELATIPTLFEEQQRLEARIERAKERLNRPTSFGVDLDELQQELRDAEEDRDEEYIEQIYGAIAALEQVQDSLDSQFAEEEEEDQDYADRILAAADALNRGVDYYLTRQSAEEQLLNDFRNSTLEEGIPPIGDGPAEMPEFDGEPEDDFPEGEPGADTPQITPPADPLSSTKKEQRKRLVNIATGGGSGEFAAETKNELIDLIIGLSNCDRQNNAEVYTEFIMFLVDELGAPILEYFDEWSEWLNAWDVKNLDFCNLPDLNLPKFKLFPLNIRLPDISMPDIFGFILGAILAILYALLLRLIRALIQFLLSLIPDFIFDFEPCEFANALRDFARVLAGAICAGTNGVDLPAFAACSVLTPRTNNERNNRDLLNFFKDACGKGILPGPNLARLLEGDANEETRQRADVYFQAINPDLASEIKQNPSILSDAGSAMGSIIGIGDLLDTLDDFTPRLSGLSANGFVDNLDLCSDPSISDLIDQLCTEPNPALREELERILRQQREADKDDAAKLFRFLTDPESLAREIEDQLPNQAHPSLVIPQLAAAGQNNELPVVKNTPKFALNRDQETVGEFHEDSIKASLGSLDTCVAAYGSSLVKRSKRYEDKIDKLNSPFRAAKPKKDSIVLAELDLDLPKIINEAFANNLFYLDEMPEGAKELAYRIIRENPEIDVSDKKSFDIGTKYYEEQVFSPLSEIVIPGTRNEDSPFYNLVNTADITYFDGPLNVNRIEEGLLVKQVLDKISFNEEVKFNQMARQMLEAGKNITAASFKNRLESAGIELDDEEINELTTEGEETPPAQEIALDGDGNPVLDEDGNPVLDEIDPFDLPKGDASRLLPSSQLEAVMEDYLNGTFKQENTYKRFIRELPEYSQLLLVKTDNEIVSIKENIRTIFKCIILEDAHLRFAVLNTSGNIFSTNNFSTANYNRSSVAQKIKDEINTLFSDFEVNYLNYKIYGWNAISYYVYEIAKTTGQLSSLSRSLGRRATPQDLMFELIEKAVEDVNNSFVTDLSAENQLLYSAIEGTERSSIIINFETPNLLEGRDRFPQLNNFLASSVTPNGASQSFLTSNMCFAVTLKAGALADSLGALTLADITSEEQRSGTNSSGFSIDASGAGKGALQTAVLESLKANETVLLSYDDVFGTNADLSLMNKLLAYAEFDQSLNDFVFDNFKVEIKYRVFTSYATKRLTESQVVENSVIGTNSEVKSLGLYKDQKISTMFVGEGSPWNVGATFIMTELCTFEKEILSFGIVRDNNLQNLENGQFISKLMQTSNTSPLANEFKGSASINIFLSCMLPFPNIINEATSYSVGNVIGEIDKTRGEAGPLGLRGKVEVRDIIFKPVKIQNKICTKVSKDLLKNV